MKEWTTSAELAELPGMPGTQQGVTIKAKREGWQSRARAARGGGREYHISSLPEQTRAYLAAQHLNKYPPLTAGAIADAAQTVAVGDRVNGSFILAGRDKQRAEARLSLLALLDEFQHASSLSKSKSLHQFCALYNAGDVVVPDHVRAEIADVHPSTVMRWSKTLHTAGAQRLAGEYGNRRGSGKINSQPVLRDFVLAMLTSYPHASSRHVMRAITTRLAGEVDMPSKRAVERWLADWKQQNKQLFTAVTNPDAWKSNYMPAFGSASAHVIALNQLWELDSSPADVMLLDGRHSLIACVDVYSRRGKLHVSKTSTAAAVAHVTRNALLDWGIPETAKTDNGADYKSHHIRNTFIALGITQDFCPPFQPWKKPHVERFFHTFAHDLVELLPGFIGHNVAERKAIEARKAFSERLFKKDQVVELSMTSAELQAFCDAWVENIYHLQSHDSLNGKTPFQMAAEWTAPARRIDDARALDMLLIEESRRVVGKKGIRIDGGNYIHADLALIVGNEVTCKRDPEDAGRLYVFHGEPLRFICIAEDPEITGVSRQDIALAATRKRKEFSEQIAALRKNAKQQTVADIAKEIISSAAQNNNITLLPRAAETHTTDHLNAAGAASRAHMTPKPTIEFTDAQREQLAAEIAAPAQIIAAEDPARRYARWARIERRIAAGEYVKPEDRDGLARYRQTSEYRVEKQLVDDFGEQEYRMDA